ncbi:MAG: hypothetical protein OEM02_03220 [Desulfobulbaceae bacterium]|nr:hypothetical protein [Desulfobulbaceae bacterium]
MTPLVPIMLFGWVPLTIILFYSLPPHRAVLVSMIGGWLLLPSTGYNWPGIPSYEKYTAISLGLVLGARLSGQRHRVDFKWKLYDLPMVMWCLSPISASLANQLGFYNGLSGFYSQVMTWGIPYLAGRIYFKDNAALRDLCLGIVIGGMVYALLCLYEIRMSPQLNNIFYGFFPHSWRQHFRYDGWRPIVFMQHGLMVSLWMALSTTVAFWLWRSRAVVRIGWFPIAFIVVVLIVTTVLCKSANGWFALLIGCGGYVVHRIFKCNIAFTMLLLAIPLYLIMRISGIINGRDIDVLVGKVFDVERTKSLAIRLLQEDLFTRKTLERPFLGWAGYGRGWPVDPDTGRPLIKMIDSLWLITFNTKGFLGLVSLVVAMLIGPWHLRPTVKSSKEMGVVTMMPVMLSLIVVLFMIDSLFNAMVNPIYILISGALVGWHLGQKAASIE